MAQNTMGGVRMAARSCCVPPPRCRELADNTGKSAALDLLPEEKEPPEAKEKPA